MKVPRQLHFTPIESMLSELQNAGSYVLTLPLENRHQALGGEAALTQAFITWAKQEVTPTMRLAVLTMPSFGEAVARFASLNATLLATKILVGSQDVTEQMTRAALKRLEILQGTKPRDASRGPQIEIVCADHLGRSYPVTLYGTVADGNPVPRPPSELGDFCRLILRTTMAAEHDRGETQNMVEPLAGALYELFRNTHEHARTDFQGNFVKPSVRAIQARRHSITPQVLGQMAEDTPAMARYCRRLQPRRGRSQLQLLEISVLDSGPGLAASWMKRAVVAADDGTDELAAVLECFAKGASTKPRPGAGMGLPNMIGLMRKANGFLRLRTGSQSLCADLGLERDEAFGSLPRLAALHGARLIAPASGTLYTLLLPIGETG